MCAGKPDPTPDDPQLNGPTGIRHAHHKADEQEKKTPRVLALKSEMLFGPGLAFVVGAVAVGAFLAYVGSGIGLILLGGLIAGVVMAIGAISIGAV
jgi:uncharacterized membrane-anchored protein